jgi:subtilisin family serine protease/subtilisin-like proprotein convertase family protein
LALEVLEDRTLPSVTPTTILDLNGLSANPNQFSSTDILVRFQTPPGQGGPAVVAGTSLGGALPLETNTYQVNLGKGMTVANALAAYRAEAGVVDAEPDYHLTVSSVPNDPLLNQQWYLTGSGPYAGTPGANIHAEQAWSVTTGSPGIVIGMMDTGIDYNSPDLYQNIWINQAEIPDYWYTKSSPTGGYNKIVYKSEIRTETPGVITFRDLNNPVNKGLVWDNNGDGHIDAGDLLRPVSQGGWDSGSTRDGDTAHPDDFFGWNFVANTNNPFDDSGHGTNVAGILGATGDNGTGVAGVDWNVRLMPVKFLGSNGQGTVSSFILGLNYAVQHGAKITNNSWEGAPYSGALYDAINNARLHGQIFVAAAGNEGTSNDQTPNYPASFSQSLNNVVAVAATDNTDHLASFSNYGPHSVALAAPGVNIVSTLPGGRYGPMTGTSMATPEVTGALALVWGEHPDWSYTQVIDQVLNTVDRLPSLQGKVATGGRLDVAAAVGWNLSTRTTPIITSVTAQGPTPTSTTMDSLWLTFNEPIDVSTFAAASVRLTDPSGQLIPVLVRVVWNSGDRQMALIFPNQVVPGNYQLSIDSNVRDLMGNRLDPYQATITVHGPATYTNYSPAAINPRSTTTSTITVPSGTTVGKVQLRIDVSYPDDGDLYIRLTAPNGTTVLLVDRRGGTGANFQNTTFDDSARAIAYGAAPYAGTYQPESLLSDLNGSQAGGVWKLSIQDVGGHSGRLLNWSLSIDPADSGPSIVKTSRPASASTASNTAIASPAPPVSASSVPGQGVQIVSQLGSDFSVPTVPTSAPRVDPPATPASSGGLFNSLGNLARLLTNLLVGKRPSNGFANT